MKKLLLSLFVVLFCGFLTAQNAANLKLNLEKNKTYKFHSSSEQTVSQTVNGMQQSSQVQNLSYTSIKMVDSKPEFMIAEVRFDSIITNTNAAGKITKVNSNNPGNMKSADAGEIMGSVMNRLCSNPLFVKMDYSGKVLEIINQKLFTDVVTKDIDSIQGQMAPMIKTQINSAVKLEALKTMVESQFAYLPGKQVAVGESWDITLVVNSGGMALNTASKYKLTGIANNIATISAEVNIAPAGSEPMDMGGMKISYDDLKGLGKSTLMIDLNTGLIKESHGKSNIAGTMSIDMGGNNMQIPLEIQSESKNTAIQ